jgi:hypothetical protein
MNKETIIKNKFNTLSEYNPSKGGEFLEEQLVPAKLDDLKHAMEQDKELYTFLNTPAKDLPEHYKFLVDEIYNDSENTTLYSLIKLALTYRMRGTQTISYFSKSGSKITGFAAYILYVYGNEVIEIKMFSFNPSQGSDAVLIRDLNNLLRDLVQKYNRVSWSAMKDNPANRIYEKAIEIYGGTMKEKKEEIHYCIEKI